MLKKSTSTLNLYLSASVNLARFHHWLSQDKRCVLRTVIVLWEGIYIWQFDFILYRTVCIVFLQYFFTVYERAPPLLRMCIQIMAFLLDTKGQNCYTDHIISMWKPWKLKISFNINWGIKCSACSLWVCSSTIVLTLLHESKMALEFE